MLGKTVWQRAEKIANRVVGHVEGHDEAPVLVFGLAGGHLGQEAELVALVLQHFLSEPRRTRMSE